MKATLVRKASFLLNDIRQVLVKIDRTVPEGNLIFVLNTDKHIFKERCRDDYAEGTQTEPEQGNYLNQIKSH